MSTDTKWYGSWPRGFKSNPITQVARESISATNEVASTFLASPATNATQSSASSVKSPALRRLSRSIKSSASSPSIATTSVNSNIPSTSSAIPTPLLTPSSEPPRPISPNKDFIEPQVTEKRRQELPQDGAGSQNSPATAAGAETDSTLPYKAIGDPSKWITWFSKSSATVAQNSPLSADASAKLESDSKDPGEQRGTMDLSKSGPVDDSKPAPGLEELPSSISSGPVDSTASQSDSRNWSWLGFWKDAAIQPKSNVAVTDSAPITETSGSQTLRDPTNPTENASKPSLSDNSTASQPLAPSKSTGWAFWSKDRSQDESSEQVENAGKLVLAEIPTQSRPDNDVTADIPKDMPQLKKQERPRSRDIPNEVNPTELLKAQPLKGKMSSTTVVDPNIKSMEKSEVRTKKAPPNLVLPAFKNTYKAVAKPSLIQQISRLLKYTRPPDTQHVNLLQEPARIKNALAIVR